MFAISRSLLACHFYSTLTAFVYFYPTFIVFSVHLEHYFYLVVFPLSAVHLTFQGHHRYSVLNPWVGMCCLLYPVFRFLQFFLPHNLFKISELFIIIINSSIYALSSHLLSYSLTLSNHSIRFFLYDFVYTKMRQQSEKSSCFFECLQNILSIQCSIFVHFWM